MQRLRGTRQYKTPTYTKTHTDYRVDMHSIHYPSMQASIIHHCAQRLLCSSILGCVVEEI
jgi:hypothetical protein